MAGNLKTARGKAPLGLLPGVGLEATAAAFEHGAAKYFPNNWRECDIDEVPTWYHAILRHMFKLCAGETHDPESGVHHLAHAAAGALIALTLLDEGYVEPRSTRDKPETKALVNSAKALFGKCPPGVPTSVIRAKEVTYREGGDKLGVHDA